MRMTERVHFRLIQTPCCSALLCWVNPRLPNYCPECGFRVYTEVRACILVSDDHATLRCESSLPKSSKPDVTQL